MYLIYSKIIKMFDSEAEKKSSEIKISFGDVSPNSYFKSGKFPSETLDDQIDRLNNVVQYLMKGSIQYPTPKITSFLSENYQDSIISDYSRVASRKSNFEDWDFESPSQMLTGPEEEIWKNIETVLQNLDRAYMVIEDCRSNELRKSEEDMDLSEFDFELKITEPSREVPGHRHQNHNSIDEIAEALENSFNKEIQIDTQELLQLKREVDYLVCLTEGENLTKSTLNIGSLKVLVDLTDKSFNPKTKQEITDLFKKEPQTTYIRKLEEEITNLKMQTAIPKEVYEFGKHLESRMHFAYQELKNCEFENCDVSKFSIDTCSSFSGMRSNSLLEIEMRKLQKIKADKEKVQQELDWLCSETKLLRAQYQQKLKDLEEYKTSQENIIRQEKAKLEEEWNQLDHERSNFREHQKEITINIRKKELELERLQVSARLPSARTPENSKFQDNNIQDLEKEMEELEKKLNSAKPQEKESIKIRIARLKTKIQGIRSRKVISDSAKRPSILENKFTSVQKHWENQDVKASVSRNTSFRLSDSIDASQPVSFRSPRFHTLLESRESLSQFRPRNLESPSLGRPPVPKINIREGIHQFSPIHKTCKRQNFRETSEDSSNEFRDRLFSFESDEEELARISYEIKKT